MAFKLCCDKQKIEKYSLQHVAIVKSHKCELIDLILYLPEMESYQTLHETIFSNDAYDDYLYDLFIKKMSLSLEDIKFIESSSPPTINRTDGEYFLNKICKSCQKIIFQKRTTKNKVAEIFRHIRNTISHGCFNIVDDYFIGFDHPKYGSDEYSAVFKVKYSNLISTLNMMSKLDTLTELYKVILEDLGYEILNNKDYYTYGDLFVRKDNILYCLEFKKYNGRYISQIDIEQVVNNLRHIDKTNLIYILVIDSTYTNAKINRYVLNEHISILDKKFIKEMLEGRDVLKELSDIQIKNAQ